MQRPPAGADAAGGAAQAGPPQPATPAAAAAAAGAVPFAAATAAAAAAGPAPGALPSYLAGAPEAFVKQADVRFVTADGRQLPVHTQFLSRCCALFSELLDTGEPLPDWFESGEEEGPGQGAQQAQAQVQAQLGVQGRPTAAAPLRVTLDRHNGHEVELALQAVYHPHRADAVAAALHGAAAYGSLLDLAAFLRFGGLLDALRAPLSVRSAQMGELVGLDFIGWLEVADRHNLDQLRSYCLECLLHLLVAPGSTRRPDEPGIDQLQWDVLSKEHLLLLLDGLASGVRSCTRSSYEVRTRVPCNTAGAGALAGSVPGAAPGSTVAGLAGGGSGGSLSSPLAGLAGGTGPFAGARPRDSPAAPATAGFGGNPQQALLLPRGHHLATVVVPKLRQADIQGSLPGEAQIASWRQMGDMCHAASV